MDLHFVFILYYYVNKWYSAYAMIRFFFCNWKLVKSSVNLRFKRTEIIKICALIVDNILYMQNMVHWNDGLLLVHSNLKLVLRIIKKKLY